MSTATGEGEAVVQPPKISGPWDLERIHEHLDDAAIPIRLSCNRRSGFPLVASHWFVRKDESIWCAVQGASAVARALTRDPRCGFEVSGDQPPYFGVRGSAQVTVHGDLGGDTLRELLARYHGNLRSRFAQWLMGRADTEVALELRPVAYYSWDYRSRMS